MSNLRIAVDINEVLRDYLRQFADTYKKVIDNDFDISYEEMNDFDLIKVFPFYDKNGRLDRKAFSAFRYEECAFEIHARAETMDQRLAAAFGLWLQNTMRNFDDNKVPEILLFSPFESGLTIPSTLSFLSRIGIKVREIHFPTDSFTMWDKCDIMITANPNLLNATPEGKVSIKVNAPYNKEAKATYTFGSMMEVIHDNTITKLIETRND